MNESQSNDHHQSKAADSGLIGLWLVPDESHYQPWASLIAKLAKQTTSPVFDPHVSLQAGKRAESIDLPELLRQVAKHTAPIELPVLCVDHGEAFFKSVFARMPSEPVRTLSAELSVAMLDPEAFVLDAHLSLVYAKLEVTDRERICRSISVPTERIIFNRIVLVEPGEGECDFANVDRWQVTGSVMLTG